MTIDRRCCVTGLKIFGDRNIQPFASKKLSVASGYHCMYYISALSLQPHAYTVRIHAGLVEEKQIVAGIAITNKLFPQQKLDQRLVQFLHVKNTALLLVDVRCINHHPLQVRC
jgi:hypothetical protein